MTNDPVSALRDIAMYANVAADLYPRITKLLDEADVPLEKRSIVIQYLMICAPTWQGLGMCPGGKVQ